MDETDVRLTDVFDLSSKVAVVTGGNAGIGFGMAAALCAAGGRVVLLGRNPDANVEAVDRLQRQGGAAASLVVDVSEEDAVDEAMAIVAERFGRIDVVTAAAGVAAQPKPFLEQTRGDWSGTLDINLFGTAHVFRAALRHMIERHAAGDGGGSLIAVASLSAKSGAPRMQPYAASKAAIVSLVQDLAVEAGRYEVRANVVLPGWTETALTQEARADTRINSMVEKRAPLGRWARPEDYGALAVYLASDGSRFHTGDVLTVDGGFSLT